MDLSRREFLVGCSAAIASMTGGRVGNLFFGSEAQAANTTTNEIMVVVFLRGGCDGLSLLSPYDDPIYVASRGAIAVPGSGANAALTLNANNPTMTSSMGLHPKASALKELYDSQQLAIIHACGLDDETRSHFDAMDYIERGTPGNKSTPSGWLTRHLQSSGIDGAGALLSSLAASSTMPNSLLADSQNVAMTSASGFNLSSPSRYTNMTLPFNMLDTIKSMHSGENPLDITGLRTVEFIQTLKSRNLTYTPETGVVYPNHSFGNTLKLVAQMIKMDLGMQIATVDFGGWDTHESQGNGGTGYFASQIDVLSRGLQAFYTDLPNHQSRLTVVVMSEFGRRLGVNSSQGTDHGHGNTMMVLGGHVNGGKIYGRWPGLQDLDQGEDLRITTDYRTVLSEILIKRLGNPMLGLVFPGLPGYNPLGVVQGTELPPNLDAFPYKTFQPLTQR